MALPNNFNFPYLSSPPPPPHPSFPPPPPPSHPISPPPPPHHPIIPPPPPHVRPPPPPLPPPTPDNHPTVIIIVFVSCGCLFLLAFLGFALCCCIKKKKKKTVEKADIVHIDEHMKVKEAIVPGPHGQQAVVLEIEEDVHMDEEVIKKEKVGEGLHAESGGENPGTIEAGASSSASDDHNLQHKPQS